MRCSCRTPTGTTNRPTAPTFEMTLYAKPPTQQTRHHNPAIQLPREKMASFLFGGEDASLYFAFFDCDCDCSAERRRSVGIIESCHLANYFVCDALHDSILLLAAGMNATPAALPSFVVVDVSSWWGWYRRTMAILDVGRCLLFA